MKVREREGQRHRERRQREGEIWRERERESKEGEKRFLQLSLFPPLSLSLKRT